jgi:hypothetical protein
MRQLDYVSVFWRLLSVQWAMFCSAFVFGFLFLWINLRQASSNSAVLLQCGQACRPAFLSRADAVPQTVIDFSPGLVKLSAHDRILMTAVIAVAG